MNQFGQKIFNVKFRLEFGDAVIHYESNALATPTLGGAMPEFKNASIEISMDDKIEIIRLEPKDWAEFEAPDSNNRRRDAVNATRRRSE